MENIYVECMGLPVLGFPEHLVDPTSDDQIVRVPFITIRRTTYENGCYVRLVRGASGGCFHIKQYGLQPHLLIDI